MSLCYMVGNNCEVTIDQGFILLGTDHQSIGFELRSLSPIVREVNITHLSDEYQLLNVETASRLRQMNQTTVRNQDYKLAFRF